MSETDVTSPIRYLAPYLEWAKTRPSPELDLAGSNILACSLDDLPGARDAVGLSGANDTGYAPLMEAIAARYGTTAGRVTTASGTSGANFLVCAALLQPGDDVLVERPGYDPLLGAARMFGARTLRFERTFETGFALDPGRVTAALTPRTRLIVLTHPHNPTGVAADRAAHRRDWPHRGPRGRARARRRGLPRCRAMDGSRQPNATTCSSRPAA